MVVNARHGETTIYCPVLTHLMKTEHQMNDDTIRLNICLTPPTHTAKEIVALAERLPETEQHFRVDGEKRHPHITAFMGVFAAARVDEIIDRLQHLPGIRPLHCSAYGVTVSSNRYVEIGYNRSADLDILQSSAATAIAGLRMPTADSCDDPGMSELEASNQFAYGYKLFGQSFRPHITLAAYRGSTEAILIPITKSFYHLDFVADEITIAQSDDFGSVTRIIERIPLPVAE